LRARQYLGRVSGVDPLLASALATQLERWRTTLGAGARRVGWKLGMGERERIGPGPVIGNLTSATQLESGATYSAKGAGALHADVEVGLVLRRDVNPEADRDTAREAIGGYGAAFEFVDLATPPDDPESIVAANVFHRAFVLGRLDRTLALDGEFDGRLIVNGEVRAEAAGSRDFAELVRSVAALLGAMGEGLQAGDCLITGAVVQLPVEPGDEVVADLGPLGSTTAAIAP
jgi:2-keto-4-pentenoate hydratase